MLVLGPPRRGVGIHGVERGPAELGCLDPCELRVEPAVPGLCRAVPALFTPRPPFLPLCAPLVGSGPTFWGPDLRPFFFASLPSLGDFFALVIALARKITINGASQEFLTKNDLGRARVRAGIVRNGRHASGRSYTATLPLRPPPLSFPPTAAITGGQGRAVPYTRPPLPSFQPTAALHDTCPFQPCLARIAHPQPVARERRAAR